MDVSSSAPAVGATPGRAVVQVQFILKFPGRAPSRAARSTSCSGGWESDRSSRPAEAPRDSSKIDWAGAEAGAKMSVGPQCGRMACPNAAPIDINAVPPGQQMSAKQPARQPGAVEESWRGRQTLRTDSTPSCAESIRKRCYDFIEQL